MQCPAIDNVMVRSTRPFSFIQKKVDVGRSENKAKSSQICLQSGEAIIQLGSRAKCVLAIVKSVTETMTSRF